MLSMQKYFKTKSGLGISVFFLFLLSGCGLSSTPKLDTVTMTPERLARQSMQTRFFEVDQLDTLIRAAMNVIQDQHYTIRETNAQAGMIFADQTNELGAPVRLFGFPIAGGGIGSSSPGFGVSFGPFLSFGDSPDIPYVQRQIGSISVVIYPVVDKKGYEMHVSVELRSFLNTGMLNEVWLIKDATIYQKFFESVSKALYLEDHP